MSTLKSSEIGNWPPPYEIRFSPRAKRIGLKITPDNGLEVIIPSFRKRFNISSLLEEKKNWITKHLAVVHSGAVKLSTKQHLPKILALNAMQEIWQIIYIEADNKKLEIIEHKNKLTFYGQINPADIQKHLILWLKKYAKQFFTPKLDDLSKKTSLFYKQLTIRGQQTLWGSCTTNHCISLNFKLLFLPKAIVNYVLLHELCHIKHLNHSNKFWRLLEQHDNCYLSHDKELKNGDHYVPPWVLNFK